MERPPFYSLVEGKKCPICLSPFPVSPYTSRIKGCEEVDHSITFLKDCFAHPVHFMCLFDYRYMLRMKNRECANDPDMVPYVFKCQTCIRPVDNNASNFIDFNCMYPPSVDLEPPNPQLPLAPVMLDYKNGLTLQNYRSGCCEYPHFFKEWFIVAKPCGHTMHTRCYLNLRLGDLSWINTGERSPTTPIHCPTCQALIEDAETHTVLKFPN